MSGVTDSLGGQATGKRAGPRHLVAVPRYMERGASIEELPDDALEMLLRG